MRQRYKDSVQVLNAQEVAGYGGQKVQDWEGAQPSAPVPAQVYPVRGSREDEDRRQLTITRWEIHLPVGTAVGDESRILLRTGELLEVEGEVGTAMLQGQPHHLELVGRRYEEGSEA